MGNLCSRGSNAAATSDPFDRPGRTIGSAPPQPPNPRIGVPRIASGGGKTLGGVSEGEGEGGGGGGGGGDARSAAARAAEERAAKASQASQKGKLGRDLAREKAQTMNGALGSASREERRRRDADEGAEARNWN